MTSSFLRPAILALALAGLAGCGGKATFDIAGTIEGLQYPGLVLTETHSGATVTISDINQKTFTFPNSIEYGTPFSVEIKPTGQPPHQQCGVDRGAAGSAGQMASINVRVVCIVATHTVGGAITLAPGTGSHVGLKIINGSNNLAPIAITAPTMLTYAFPDIRYNTPYGITILSQPDDANVRCKLVPAAPKPDDLFDKVSGTVGDTNVVINILCAKP